MPDEALEAVLRLLAEGRLTAEEAGPILDALDDTAAAPRDGSATPTGAAAADGQAADPPNDDRPARIFRVHVTEHGRTVINLRIPLALGRAAITKVPGISEATSDRIREAIDAGTKGSILEVDDAGDGVRISIE